ncbi:MAG: hypothetical protein KJT01_07865 [Gemmatimonadetes bacterium]|nr:hypothetical protein [Gemmatimonadota bacterium]
MTRHRRTGTLLPALLVPLALLALIAAASATDSVASHHEAMQGARGATTLAAAESALDALIAQLRRNPAPPSAGTPPSHPAPGESLVLTLPRRDGLHAVAIATRPHPYLVWVVGTAEFPAPTRLSDPHGRHAPVVSRRVERALWLLPPTVETAAAITSRAPLFSASTAQVDGSDAPATDTPCPPARERVSLPPVRIGLPVDADTATVRQRLPPESPAHLPSAPPAQPPGRWAAIAIRPPQLGLLGAHQWRGLLLVDGDLTLHGTLAVHGVLLVLGRLLGDGALQVRGAVVILARDGGTSTLGAASRVAYDRCTTQLALATVAAVLPGPTGHWGIGTQDRIP